MANSKKNSIERSIFKEIEKYLKSPSLKKLDKEQIEKIAKAVYIDKLKKEFEREVKIFNMNNDELILDWLNQYKSEETKRVYKKNILEFLNWLEGRKKNSLIDVNNKVADNYIVYVNNQKLSTNSIRLRIATCSSFFRQLVRWEIVYINPFRDSKSIPKRQIERKSISDIPSKSDLLFLEKIAQLGINALGRGSAKKRQGAKKAFLAIRIMRETGLRIGALEGLKIDPNGYFKTKSKGRLVEGKLSKNILRLIQELNFNKENPLLNYKRNTFGMWLHRTTKKFDIKNYGAHSIRHWWAVLFYKKNKDIVSLQKALGHKSLHSTQAYLASLKNHLEM